MITDLSGRVALVGGSTDGIGKAIAVKLAECGASVCVNGRDAEKASRLIAEIEADGGEAMFVAADLRDPNQCERLVGAVVDRYGRLDIAVANGGGRAPGRRAFPDYFRNTSIEDFAEIIHSRWLSRAYLMRAAIEPMIEQNYGKIVVITTDAGRWPTPGESINGGAAAGLMMMSRVAAKEFTRWGIRVNTIALSLTGDSAEEFEAVLSAEVGATFRKALDKMPFGLTPRHEVADAALFFASPESDHCTGATLSINGGLSFP